MSSWMTNVRIPVQEWRQADEQRRDELIYAADRRVRVTLKSATDHDVEVTTWWAYVIPGSDPTASEFHVNGPTVTAWTPSEDVPEAAAELLCRGRTVT